MFFFFFKQKTAYEMRISDWSSDVCSSDLGFALRPLELVFEQRPETRMRAALDDQLRPLLRAEPAKIRQSLLGDENLHILGNMIDMAYKRHNRRDRTALCGRRRHEDRDKGVTCKVARSPDPVLDARAHHMGGIDVAVDIGLD